MADSSAFTGLIEDFEPPSTPNQESNTEQEIAFLMPPEVGVTIRERAEHEALHVSTWMFRAIGQKLGLALPPPPPRGHQRGREPTGATRRCGMRLMRFRTIPEIADAIEAAARRDHLTRGEWIRRALCEAVGAIPPTPGRRGPKPKAQKLMRECPIPTAFDLARPSGPGSVPPSTPPVLRQQA